MNWEFVSKFNIIHNGIVFIALNIFQHFGWIPYVGTALAAGITIVYIILGLLFNFIIWSILSNVKKTSDFDKWIYLSLIISPFSGLGLLIGHYLAP